MEIGDLTTKKVLLHLLKDFTNVHTITTLATELNLSRVGMWKVLKKLGSEKYIVLKSVGGGKTSTYTLFLNWDNPLVEKILSFYLTEEALTQRRWRFTFSDIENITDFVILYGSIIYSPKQANDIDILGICSQKFFIKIQHAMEKIQNTQVQQIHSINFTEREFRAELKWQNKAFISAVKKGVVLFGAEHFVTFMRGMAHDYNTKNS